MFLKVNDVKNRAKYVASAIALSVCASVAFAGSPISVTVDPTSPGTKIPADFMGVSMESQTMLPDANGKYYFSPDNKPLISMFKLLGITSLRVGGNTSDNPKIKVPGNSDIDSLFAFSDAVGAKVIYGLRFRLDPKPKDDAARNEAYAALTKDDAAIAKYVMDHYKNDVICFELGNEPNVYIKVYADYKDAMEKSVDVIRTPACAPDAVFCGPNATPGKGDWARNMAADLGKTGQLCMITQHSYPGGNSRKVADPAVGRESMLSPKWLDSYQKMYNLFVPTVIENKIPFRIEETNSFFNGGLKDASNTHASALWGLDYMYWWASHGAAGLNFHTGDHVAAADENAPCWYALFWTSPQEGGGYHAHPLAYAVKAFDLGAGGGRARFVPVKMDSKDNLNLNAYSVLDDDKNLYVTMINKEHGTNGQNATVALNIPGYSQAEMMTLGVPGGDISAKEGETLGGAEIKDDGTWDGKWTVTDAGAVEIPAATAVVVKLSPQ